MQEIEIEDYVKLGYDDRSGPFLRLVDSELPYALAIELEKSSKEIHDLTCAVKKINTWSKTGRNYLSDKMIHVKIKLTVEAELVDDTPIPEAEQEIEKKIRVWKDYGGTRTEALEKIKKEKEKAELKLPNSES